MKFVIISPIDHRYVTAYSPVTHSFAWVSGHTEADALVFESEVLALDAIKDRNREFGRRNPKVFEVQLLDSTDYLTSLIEHGIVSSDT